MRLQLHAAAEEELLHAAQWYEAQRSGLGAELLAEIDRALAVVAETGSTWPLWR
jgi:hypothetical protein